MNVDIEIIRKKECEVRDDFLRLVVETTIARVGRSSFVSHDRISVSIVLVDDGLIRELNREHRGKDASTDILSFPTSESDPIEPDPEGDCMLGDLILSVPFIAPSAESDGVSFERELAYVLSHGVLHLLGHDHSEDMFAIQEAVTDSVAGEGSVE